MIETAFLFSLGFSLAYGAIEAADRWSLAHGSGMRPLDALPRLLIACLTGLSFDFGIRSDNTPFQDARFVALSLAILFLGLVDIRLHRLPFKFTVPLLCFGIGLSGVSAISLGEPHQFVLSIVGALCGFLPLAVLSLAMPRKLGFGDAVLLGAMGAMLGPLALLPVLVLSSLFVLASSAVLVSVFRGKVPFLKIVVPYGPFLLQAALFVLVLHSLLPVPLGTILK